MYCSAYYIKKTLSRHKNRAVNFHAFHDNEIIGLVAKTSIKHSILYHKQFSSI